MVACYQATTGGQTTEGHGFGATGKEGELAGALRDFRIAADEGTYVRVGELGPDSPKEDLEKAYTLRDVVAKARAGGRQAPTAMYASRTTSSRKIRAKRCWTSSWATAATASGRGVAADVFVVDDDDLPDFAVFFASVPFQKYRRKQNAAGKDVIIRESDEAAFDAAVAAAA